MDGLTSDTKDEIIIFIERIAVVPADRISFSPSCALFILILGSCFLCIRNA